MSPSKGKTRYDHHNEIKILKSQQHQQQQQQRMN